MLALTRKEGERIQLGDDVSIVILRTGRNVRIGIEAPRDVRIIRSELLAEKPTEETAECLTSKS